MFCLYITHGEAPESCSVALALLASNSALPTSPSTHHRPRIESVSYFSFHQLRRSPRFESVSSKTHQTSAPWANPRAPIGGLKKKRKEMARLSLSLEDPPHVVNHRCTGPKKAPKWNDIFLSVPPSLFGHQMNETQDKKSSGRAQ